MFSPDGRIYQVEYAREAVKRGTTAVGVTYGDGCVIMVDKRVTSKLIESKNVEKIFKLDAHIGCASSGLVGDARALVARARMDAQNNRVTFDEPIEVEVLVKGLSDIQQSYTQNGGVRPFGAAFLIAGIDADGRTRLFETDPSGAVVAYKATAIGVGRAQAMEFLEEKYRDISTLDAAAKLGWKALLKAAESGNTGVPPTPDMAVVTRGEGFRKLTAEEIQHFTAA
ncbi:MAG: archaeal proteasome endopeptidase complex subunit alpha [Thermoplasmatota archaeon]